MEYQVCYYDYMFSKEMTHFFMFKHKPDTDEKILRHSIAFLISVSSFRKMAVSSAN